MIAAITVQHVLVSSIWVGATEVSQLTDLCVLLFELGGYLTGTGLCATPFWSEKLVSSLSGSRSFPDFECYPLEWQSAGGEEFCLAASVSGNLKPFTTVFWLLARIYQLLFCLKRTPLSSGATWLMLMQSVPDTLPRERWLKYEVISSNELLSPKW